MFYIYYVRQYINGYLKNPPSSSLGWAFKKKFNSNVNLKIMYNSCKINIPCSRKCHYIVQAGINSKK